MIENQKYELEKRLKSFAWRTGMMILAAVITFVLENLNLLHIPPVFVPIIGLVLGEVSKYINNALTA